MSIISEALRRANELRELSLECKENPSAISKVVPRQEHKGQAAPSPGFVWLVGGVALLFAVAYFFTQPRTLQPNASLGQSHKTSGLQAQTIASFKADSGAELESPGMGYMEVEETVLKELAQGPSLGPAIVFALSGTAHSGNTHYAIINEKVLKVGDVIEGAKVALILDDKVELDVNGQRVVLQKEF